MDDVVLPLVQAICGFARPIDNGRALGLVSGKKLIGGVVFHNWQPEHGVIEVTAASLSPKWFTRGIMNEVTRYAFEKCGCHAMVARTEPKGPASRIWRALGSDEVSIPHLRGRGKPETVFVLTDTAWQKCKFRSNDNG